MNQHVQLLSLFENGFQLLYPSLWLGVSLDGASLVPTCSPGVKSAQGEPVQESMSSMLPHNGNIPVESNYLHTFLFSAFLFSPARWVKFNSVPIPNLNKGIKASAFPFSFSEFIYPRLNDLTVNDLNTCINTRRLNTLNEWYTCDFCLFLFVNWFILKKSSKVFFFFSRNPAFDCLRESRGREWWGKNAKNQDSKKNTLHVHEEDALRGNKAPGEQW